MATTQVEQNAVPKSTLNQMAHLIVHSTMLPGTLLTARKYFLKCCHVVTHASQNLTRLTLSVAKKAS